MPVPQFLKAATFATMTLTMAALPVTAQQAGQQPPTAVTVVTLKAQDVTLTTRLPGRVAASGVADVRPQVTGILVERLFTEGRPVTEGDLLYRIDPARYDAQKAAAQAALAQAQATLKAAEQEAVRQQTLRDRSVTSQQNLDDALAQRDVAEAAVQVAKANLLSAEIDQTHTEIRAPISGVVGLSQVSRGALVTAGQANALTTIRTLDPVHVDVTQSAAEMLRWRRSGGAPADLEQADSQTVTLKLADGTTYEQTGHLSAAEPYVNEQTGVVVLRLEFPNPDHLLLPGMYVQVELPQGMIENAILAPQEGVTRDRRGRPMAMIVNAQNVVETRELTIRQDQGAQWVVTEGLTDGDRLIVAGFQKIGNGMTVTPEERAAPAATQ
ncbi:membrane fusion protein, multidrug efflux system [Thalassovita litoralis]|uniref:Membrane fusion protein, multidrug efflux system n=1 Tax=Thalassovita litoralis TaxID=1010611 RepID=A0A521DIW1_9RHOB|nr:efflux RND transporter periplasmic adaptor subunit [Thalassovita litoralis]SMO71558.1 membrane fusion protein, multidrug efflux system [Thalassovita litoralis]